MIAIPIGFGYFACWIVTAALLHRFAPHFDNTFEDDELCVMLGFLWPGVVFGAVMFGFGWFVSRIVKAVS